MCNRENFKLPCKIYIFRTTSWYMVALFIFAFFFHFEKKGSGESQKDRKLSGRESLESQEDGENISVHLDKRGKKLCSPKNEFGKSGVQNFWVTVIFGVSKMAENNILNMLFVFGNFSNKSIPLLILDSDVLFRHYC